jgi:hypothetical protein
MATLAYTPLLPTTNSLVKALDIETCRKGVQKAATAKAASGRSISIRQCLLDAGFCEGQASNRTMQMRVWRQVQKQQRVTLTRRRRTEQDVPSEVCFSPSEDDLVSVLTGGSGGFRRHIPRSATPAEALPTAIHIPPPTPVPVSAANSPLLLVPEHHRQQQQQQHRHQEALRSSPNLFASAAAPLHASTLDPPILPVANSLAGVAGNSLHPTKRMLEWGSYPVPPTKRPRQDDHRVVLSPPPFTATCR